MAKNIWTGAVPRGAPRAAGHACASGEGVAGTARQVWLLCLRITANAMLRPAGGNING